MANNPFDRTIINPREKPLSQDINQAQSQLDYALRLMAFSAFGSRASNTSDAPGSVSGFHPGSLMVVPSSPIAMSVVVKKGLGYVYDGADAPSGIDSIVGLDDLSPYKPVVLLNDVTFAVPAAPGVGQARVDIIEARVNRQTTNSTSRLILDPTTGLFAPAMVDKTLSFTLDGSTGAVVTPAPSTVALSYKQGAAAAVGAEVDPVVTAGYVQIARIYVGPSVVTIDRPVIGDKRKLLGFGGMVPFSAMWRMQYNAGVPIITTRHILAPPGVRVGLLNVVGSGDKAIANISILGGGITGASVSARVSAASNNNVDIMESGAGAVIVQTTATAADINGYTPDCASPKGTVYANFTVKGRFLIAGGQTNGTDASLDDVNVLVNGFLTYF